MRVILEHNTYTTTAIGKDVAAVPTARLYKQFDSYSDARRALLDWVAERYTAHEEAIATMALGG